jgi:hypothetical protein
MGAGSFRGPAALASASAMLTLYKAVQSSMRGLSARLSRMDMAFCSATQLRAKPSITIMSPRLSTLGPSRRCCTVRFVERQERFQRRRQYHASLFQQFLDRPSAARETL